MDLNNTKLTDYDGKSSFPKTSIDRNLNKDNGFYLDTDLMAIKKALFELSDTLSPFFDVYDSGEHHKGLLHNCLWRGRFLGNEVTDKQYESIDNGSFCDLWIGDYWGIDGIAWRIAGFDYWLNTGSAGNVTTSHHVVIVPDTVLSTGAMNSTETTAGAYIGSDFYTGNNGNTAKSEAVSAVNSAFGADHVLSHKDFFANAVTDGKESSLSEYDSTVDLMNEHMVFGGKMLEIANIGNGIPAISTYCRSQLPLFSIAPRFIKSNASYWLRSAVSASGFAAVTQNGNGNYSGASNNWSVRPAFAIYKG